MGKFDIDVFITFSEYVVGSFIVFVVVKGISIFRKEKKKRDNLIKYRENRSDNGTQQVKITQRVKGTQKVTSKIIDDDDPWASFGDPWDDLDKKEEKKNA